MHSIQTQRRRQLLPLPTLLTLLVASATTAHAGGEQELQRIIITGTAASQVGVADSANVGTVTQKQLEARTAYRPGEDRKSTRLNSSHG